ncbi:MAG: hypothetical protein PHR77_02840 [Kiritimatiellae bacterium]|nr:hypothetical protein [Kiritimatiellia bacterium]MDD5521311.1 hypothetical protein [Kiritimatiellia bacterium]
MKDVKIMLKITSQSDVIFHVCVVLMVGLVLWTFCRSPFALEDINAEVMDLPLTVGHMLIAREKGISIKEYMENDPCWDNLKAEDSKGAYAYWNKSFQFYYMAHCAPLLNALFVPFSKCFGVNKESVTLFSTCFSLITFVIIFYIALIAYGRWHAVVTILFMVSSLSWLIHVKVAYGVWMVSTSLIGTIILCLYLYSTGGQRRALVISAVCLGLLFVAGWISVAFGIIMIIGGIVFGRGWSFRRVLIDLSLTVSMTIIMCVFVVTIYSFLFHCETFEVYENIRLSFSGRFSQGGVPSVHFTPWGRVIYVFRNIFLDMRSSEHVDKCLEGDPSIPPFFSILLFLGIFYAVKNRSLGDKFALAWLIIVFGFLATVFTYTHRYALVGIPAMALLASRGYFCMIENFAKSKYRKVSLIIMVLMVAGLIGSVVMTQKQFYIDYLHNKPPDFEVDRMRGHDAFAKWLKSNYEPATTLVVLGDPIMFPHTCFMFNTFGYPYNFKYWTNYVMSFKDVACLQAWEQTLCKEWEKIIYVFSPCLLGDRTSGKFWNDWRLFQSAHPNIKPMFQYRYADRQPSMIAFEISR